MPKCYFVFTDSSMEGLLQHKAATGEFGILDTVFLCVKDIPDFEEKAKVITADDSVVYIGFEPDCPRGKHIKHELNCEVLWCDKVADLKYFDFSRIFVKSPQVDEEIPEPTIVGGEV